MELIDGPRFDERSARPTAGIRREAPFRGMLAERDRMLADVVEIFGRHGVEPTGPFYLRLHTVDMGGRMRIEVGAFVSDEQALPPGLEAGAAPAGRYAVLAYRTHSVRANRHLLEWVHAQGVELDATPSEAGDAWAGRFETYLTDPRTEPRKTRWVTELAFLTR